MNEDEKTLRNLELLKPQLETISKRGIALIIFLVLIICVGIYALYIQICRGPHCDRYARQCGLGIIYCQFYLFYRDQLCRGA